MSWGGIGRPRPDQQDRPGPRRTIAPGGAASIVRARTVIVHGAAGGIFVYNAANQLVSADVGADTTDPVHGITCHAGISTFNVFGAVINLLSTARNAFFQYFDNGSAVQGALILSIASVAGTDPVDGTAYPAGMFGVDPAFGDFINVVGASILLGQVAFTRKADVIANAAADNAHNPFVTVDAPEQTGTGAAGHMQMLLQGNSPDGTRLAQLLIGEVAGAAVLAAQTQSMAEVQGNAAQPALTLIVPTATQDVLNTKQSADTNSRFKTRASGALNWGPGNAAIDCNLARSAANLMQFQTCDLGISTAGRGLRVSEGANGKQGTAVLAGGTVTVANTSVTVNSRIDHWRQVAGGTLGHLSVGVITAGVSFVINSSSNLDTSTIGFEIFEPG